MTDEPLKSDDDTSENDVDDFSDNNPFPPKCETEIIGISSFSKCMERRYDACPAFFPGTLRDACQAAFNSTIIEERRPVLVYIHNDESEKCKAFCKTMSSTMIIDYLLENYIIWPWDLTFQSNRKTLDKIWEEIFYIKFFEYFSIEQCPLLIGIMRLFEDKIDGLTTSEYQFKLLFEDTSLINIQQTINRERLINELSIFKKQCERNEQGLSFNFIRQTGLCWEIILDIVKYLSLNDMISAFSTDVLSLLNNPPRTFQLTDPCAPLVKIILRRFKPEQIISLQLNGNELWLEQHLNIFNKVICLTLLNFPYKNPINQYENSFTNLIYLSLCYDNEVNFILLTNIFNQPWTRIKRLEIHCAGILCPHYNEKNKLIKRFWLNSTVEYFLLDVGHFSLISINICFKQYTLCSLITIIDFIKTMTNIRYVYLIINKYDIKSLLDINQWITLVTDCIHLRKVNLQVLGSSLEDQQLLKKVLLEKVLQIQMELRHIQQTMQFNLHFL